MSELAVLVPVLNRPQNVKPLVESFLAGCPDNSTLYFLVSEGDDATMNAIGPIAMGARVLRTMVRSGDGSWPKKINVGVSLAGETYGLPDWFLCAADDITFTPGWWDATKELRDDPQIGVIGTNDSATGQGNPRVAAGEHTCHPLIRASYIHKFGTIDQPGYAVHEGYHHWCVDDELVWTARLRNAWAFCREAVLDHHHPYWDPSVPTDATYLLGEANAQADMALWQDRATRLLGLQIQ